MMYRLNDSRYRGAAKPIEVNHRDCAAHPRRLHDTRRAGEAARRDAPDTFAMAQSEKRPTVYQDGPQGPLFADRSRQVA